MRDDGAAAGDEDLGVGSGVVVRWHRGEGQWWVVRGGAGGAEWCGGTGRVGTEL